MTELLTRLDDRFSDPGAEPTPWATTREALEHAQLAWITTVRADGRPHVTPLVTVWVDETLHFCTGPDEQKARNLEQNRAVVLTTGCNEWERGLDVVVEGTAEPVTDRATLERLAAAWTERWDGRWRFDVTDTGFAHPAPGGPALVFAVRAAKILAFAKGGFSHTRHVGLR
ncbi:MAG: pyridoxamine 5'-phosphate oxidase family protein [Actinomycetota bacterium]|nr:pyridoxamine 5'-phosphate oxidase family protein [Actinomycetota bacterium]